MKTSIKSLTMLLIAVFVISGSTLQAQMYWNKSAQLSGTNTSYVSVPNSPTIDITSSFTIEAWVNPANTTNAKGVLAKGGSLGTSLRYAMRITNGRVNIITNGASRISSKASTLVQVNTWTHVAGTYDSSTGEFKVFVNGILDSSSIVPSASPQSNADSLFLGISGSSSPFSGKLDEVRLWNRSLSDSDVVRNMRTSLGVSSGVYSGLVLSMAFQNKVAGLSISFKDQSMNQNHGNGRNVTAIQTYFDPQHTIHQNEGVRFFGNDDYLSCPDSPGLNPNSVTLECWVYPMTNQTGIILEKGNSYSLVYEGNFVKAYINGNLIQQRTLLVNNWNYIVFSYDGGTGNSFLSRNSFFPTKQSNPAIPVSVNSDSLFIGGGPGGKPDFNGIIDEVKITAAAKSVDEFRHTVFTSIDFFNDPDEFTANINYSFDGNLADMMGFDQFELRFVGDAVFSHPGSGENIPVSPVCRDANANLSRGYYMDFTNKTIFSNATISDSILVTEKSVINDINIFIALIHEESSELTISLVSPSGDSVRLIDNFNTSSSDDNIVVVIDDNADSSMASGKYASLFCSVKPLENMLASFVGESAQGYWHIIVSDNQTGNRGYFSAWGIQINNDLIRNPGIQFLGLLQGFYNPASNSMIADTITVNVRDTVAPFNIVATAKEILQSDGLSYFSFADGLTDDKPYYLQILHRNTIESWSSNSLRFANSQLFQTYYTNITSILGNNQIQVDASPIRFALYSGDVNQDGSVDATDLAMIDNDATNFVSGYVVTDITGDESVDASDAAIADNNAANFVSAITR